jgi:hypothetical protein
MEIPESLEEARVNTFLKNVNGNHACLSAAELITRRNFLLKENEASNGWGEGNGARLDEIMEIESMLAAKNEGGQFEADMARLVEATAKVGAFAPRKNGGVTVDNTPAEVADGRLNQVYDASRELPVSAVNHPPHYTSHPTGIECIAIIEHLPANIAAAIKHLWGVGLKPGVDPDTQLAQAAWYVERERLRRRTFNV